MTGRHAGRIAVVTGAAQGLGQAFALKLAADGARVIAADRNACTETCAKIKEQGGTAESVVCDLAQDGGVAKFTAQIERCDILVNNAGVFPSQSVSQITAEDWRRVMAVNLDAPFLLSRDLSKGMKERRWGRIINITSATVAMAGPGSAHYITSKMGLIGLTRALATALGSAGITVNAVAPGLVRTPGATQRFEEDAKTLGLTFDVYEKYKAGQSIKQTIVPTDIAGAVSFLASEEASFLTGQTIAVDGGVIRL